MKIVPIYVNISLLVANPCGDDMPKIPSRTKCLNTESWAMVTHDCPLSYSETPDMELKLEGGEICMDEYVVGAKWRTLQKILKDHRNKGNKCQ